MKKVILTTLILFAGLLIINAKNQRQAERDCIGIAYAVDAAMGGISYEMFAAIVDACEGK